MKRLLILSGKGGTGKTTTAAAFIRLSESRAIADCDVDAPNLHLIGSQQVEPEITDFMGGDKAEISSERCTGCGACMESCRFNAVECVDGSYRINEFFCEGCGVCEYVCPAEAIRLNTDIAGSKELYLSDSVFSTAQLKMGRGNSGKLVTAVKMAMLKNAPETGLAVIDGSPGIGCPVIASMSGMDLVLIVAEPSNSGFSDLRRLVETAERLDTRLAVCVNKWDVSPELTEQIRNYCSEKNIPFTGVIPYDKAASVAINSGLSVVDIDCQAGEALRNIYNKTKQLINSL